MPRDDPITAGVIIGLLFPALSERMVRPLEAFSRFIFIPVALIVLVYTYHYLLAMDIRPYLAIGMMITGSLVAGYAMAPGSQEEKTTLALVSATRNTGLAMLVASAYAPLGNALPVLIPYIVLAAIVDRIYLKYSKTRPGIRKVRGINVAIQSGIVNQNGLNEER